MNRPLLPPGSASTDHVGTTQARPAPASVGEAKARLYIAATESSGGPPGWVKRHALELTVGGLAVGAFVGAGGLRPLAGVLNVSKGVVVRAAAPLLVRAVMKQFESQR